MGSLMSMLNDELTKLEKEQLSRIAEIWKIKKIANDKKAIINQLKKAASDEYYLKGILEQLTPMQVKIFSIIIGSKAVLTLGDISRRIRMQPINVENELAVLKHLMLVYQRKNRERITSNMDKYYPYEEIKEIVSIDENKKGEKFQFSIKDFIGHHKVEDLSSDYLSLVTGKKRPTIKRSELMKTGVSDETLEIVVERLSEGEQILLDAAFNNGGILEIHAARIIMDDMKLDQEKTLIKLNDLNILKDIYFIDERYVRILVIPVELFQYLKDFPIFPNTEKIKEMQPIEIGNQFDVVLNMKKLLLFVANRGLTLSQSGKIRQADMKRSENSLLDIDLRLFPEKSQVHLIEILLPFLKVFDLVELKEENVILKDTYEEFLKENPLNVIEKLLEVTPIEAEKRMVGDEVFLPIEIPFYKNDYLKEIYSILQQNPEGIYSKVLIANLIREWVILSPSFRVKDFKTLYFEKRGAMVSVLFYLHLFGMLQVEYPKRKIKISSLADYFFESKELSFQNKTDGVIINPDATLVAFPDKLSIFGLHILKSFAELKEFDRVYHFQITRESLQTGLLLGRNKSDLLDFLDEVSKNKLPQNLTYLIEDWSEGLHIVTIEEGVTLLEASDANQMSLLLGQIKGKKIVKRELSDTAILVYKDKVSETIEIAEKLEMIVKLIR